MLWFNIIICNFQPHIQGMWFNIGWAVLKRWPCTASSDKLLPMVSTHRKAAVATIELETTCLFTRWELQIHHAVLCSWCLVRSVDVALQCIVVTLSGSWLIESSGSGPKLFLATSTKATCMHELWKDTPQEMHAASQWLCNSNMELIMAYSHLDYHSFPCDLMQNSIPGKLHAAIC